MIGRAQLHSFILILAIATGTFAQTYCIPASTNYSCSAGDEYIQNVTIGSLNNSSPCGPPPGYEDFTTTVPPVVLAPGTSVPISVTVGSFWTGDRVAVFLDVDGDRTFQVSELLAILTTSVAGSGTASQVLGGSVAIPATATPGFTTRLRLRLLFGPVFLPDPLLACQAATYGNCEDYLATFAGTFVPQYQVNQAGAGCEIDGVTGIAITPAIVTRCAGTGFTVHLNSTAVGNVWDLAISPLPIVPATGGGLTLGSGQIVNLDLASTALAFGGFVTPFVPVNIPVVMNAAIGASFQMAVTSPSSPDGVWLSQATRLTIGLGSVIPGPSGDDDFVAIPLGGPPGCGPGAITFYNTNYSTMVVTSNGRAMFGVGNAGYTPSPTVAAAEAPSVGCWTNFNRLLGGSIDVDFSAPGIVSVNYTGVAYFGQPGTSSTYSIVFETSSGIVRISNVSGLGQQSAGGTLNMWLGISPGYPGGATNAGATVFYPGGSGTPASFHHEIYGFGAAPQNAGCSEILFIPAGSGYVWAAS